MTRTKGGGARPVRTLRYVALALAGIAVWQGGQAAYIHLKAIAAQYLLQRAWAQTLKGAATVRPWPGADTWPVARLRSEAYATDLIILAGTSGRSLAFGPGHHTGTAMPGEAGNALISAHRDTHFRFLQRLRHGDRLRLQTPAGAWRTFVVDSMRVVDVRRQIYIRTCEGTCLTLITCYPFNSVSSGGPLRFIARLLEVNELPPDNVASVSGKWKNTQSPKE